MIPGDDMEDVAAASDSESEAGDQERPSRPQQVVIASVWSKELFSTVVSAIRFLSALHSRTRRLMTS